MQDRKDRGALAHGRPLTHGVAHLFLWTCGILLLGRPVSALPLEGPFPGLPGAYTLSYDGAQGLGLSEDGNMARSSIDGWWVVGDDGTHAQGTLGKTAYISGAAIAGSTPAYWGPAEVGGIALSLQPGIYVAGEVMAYDPANSSLANGMLRFTGTTTIHILTGGSLTPYSKSTRWTMTVTDLSNAQPVPLVAAGSLGLPPGLGALVPITSPAQTLKIHLLFEVEEPANSWQPAYNFYNAEETANVVGGAQYTFNHGFFFDPTTPEATQISLSGQTVLVTWSNLLTGVGYSMQRTPSLIVTNWVEDLSFTAPGPTRSAAYILDGSDAQFFRLIQSP